MSETKDTCSPKCKFWKKYKEGCPFYIETTWTPHNGGQVFVVKDCAPKRSVLLTMELSNRLIGLQRAAEEERNFQHGVLAAVSEAVNAGEAIPKIVVQQTPDILEASSEELDEDNDI